MNDTPVSSPGQHRAAERKLDAPRVVSTPSKDAEDGTLDVGFALEYPNSVFRGALCHVCEWSSELSAAELRQRAFGSSKSGSLLGHWPLSARTRSQHVAGSHHDAYAIVTGCKYHRMATPHNASGLPVRLRIVTEGSCTTDTAPHDEEQHEAQVYLAPNVRIDLPRALRGQRFAVSMSPVCCVMAIYWRVLWV